MAEIIPGRDIVQHRHNGNIRLEAHERHVSFVKVTGSYELSVSKGGVKGISLLASSFPPRGNVAHSLVSEPFALWPDARVQNSNYNVGSVAKF